MFLSNLAMMPSSRFLIHYFKCLFCIMILLVSLLFGWLDPKRLHNMTNGKICINCCAALRGIYFLIAQKQFKLVLTVLHSFLTCLLKLSWESKITPKNLNSSTWSIFISSIFTLVFSLAFLLIAHWHCLSII